MSESVILPLLWSLEDTAESLLLLFSNKKYRDMYVCARTFLETLINLLYITTQGPECAEKAKMHALQKTYRDLERICAIGDSNMIIKCSLKDSMKITDDLKRALDEFTDKKGKEKRQWTDDNILIRLKCIATKCGQKRIAAFQLAFLWIYRHSSEISHGTLFGSLFFLCRTEPSKVMSAKEICLENKKRCLLIFKLFCSCIKSAILILNDYYALGGLADTSNKIQSELYDEISDVNPQQ